MARRFRLPGRGAHTHLGHCVADLGEDSAAFIATQPEPGALGIQAKDGPVRGEMGYLSSPEEQPGERLDPFAPCAFNLVG